MLYIAKINSKENIGRKYEKKRLSESLIDENGTHRLSGRDIILIVYGVVMIAVLLLIMALIGYKIIPMSLPDSYFNFMNILSSIFVYIMTALLVIYGFYILIDISTPKKWKGILWDKYSFDILLRNLVVTLLTLTIISVNVIIVVYYLILALSLLFVIVLWLDSSKN